MILIDTISPIAFSIGPIAIRWYALAYVAAFMIGLWMFKKFNKGTDNELSKKALDDLFTYTILGVILGGRLGYALFYNLPFFLENPLEIFAIWHGGMSFHGGLLGVIVATFLFARKNKIKTFSVLDKLAVIAPMGLFFGRIANFINMEVMGRVTTKPWGIVFAGSPDTMPRHPSPLYEAGLEGILLFVIMLSLWHWTKFKNKTGVLSGIFAILYGLVRIFAEQFRQPDAQLGFLIGDWLTMGMALSAAMIVAGGIVFTVAIKKK
jgi:phosphatidylglycerol:prolipoprotein diacylglycerol transferase